MQITEYIKGGTYLSAKEVIEKPNAVFIITTEGALVEKDYKGTKNTKIEVEGEFDKEKRVFDLNKTNSRAVALVLGSDTKAWIGHQLVLETYKTKNSDGKLTDAINVKQVK
jgi:hypothetical protein